ncbi:MAG: Crp/Fnr family transcriptional regulator [Hyphomicrobiaceae bacterium]|nr:Crp/Fnr family transcriptional regulator [Hyphomicrobiaceae bacterium]
MPDLKRKDLEYEGWADAGAIPLLAGLHSTVSNRLAKGIRTLNLERYAYVFQQDQPATEVHVILRGWIKLSRVDEGGNETIVHVAGPGEVLGHDGLLLNRPHQLSGETVSRARTLIVDGKALLDLMLRDPILAVRIAASLAEHTQRITRHIEQLKRLDALQRTAQFLLGLCFDGPGPCSFSLPFEKAVIAGWLGMKPASFSRALAYLREFGVTVDRDTISVLDRVQLQALVQNDPRTPGLS